MEEDEAYTGNSAYYHGSAVMKENFLKEEDRGRLLSGTGDGFCVSSSAWDTELSSVCHITNQRITDYINSMSPDNSALLEDIRREAEENHVPVIRRETESLIKTLTVLKKPGSILEIGTAVGYSALIMSEAMPEGCTITTIEQNDRRWEKAKENFRKADKESIIRLIKGDALFEIEKLECGFDMVFIDAAKGQYQEFWNRALKLCKPGALIITDNVLQEGTIVESRYLIEQRDRTVHTRMRDFLYNITHSEDVSTTILPVGDGVAVSVLRLGDSL